MINGWAERIIDASLSRHFATVSFNLRVWSLFFQRKRSLFPPIQATLIKDKPTNDDFIAQKMSVTTQEFEFEFEFKFLFSHWTS